MTSLQIHTLTDILKLHAQRTFSPDAGVRPQSAEALIVSLAWDIADLIAKDDPLFDQNAFVRHIGLWL
jgi:hypothetical protein